MRVLILTQKVDINDPVLGFFHRWLVEFSKSFEFLTAVCLQKGEFQLPENVKVLSLGKEKKASRLQYIINFYKHIWQERKNYDAVFVHMNQEYVLLGGIIWKLLGKKILLWRNHKKGSVLTDLAVFLSDKVFCTSQHSYTAQFKKTKIMPVGIDTTFFKKYVVDSKKQNSLLFFGRISPVKKVEIFIGACRVLKDDRVDFSADIVGDPTSVDQDYYDKMRSLVEEAGLSGLVTFKPSIPNTQAPALFNNYEVYINTTPKGSLDKTILEALASGTLTVTSNQTLRGFLDDRFIFAEGSPSDLAHKLSEILKWPEERKLSEAVSGSEKVKISHDLALLVKNVAEELS